MRTVGVLRELTLPQWKFFNLFSVHSPFSMVCDKVRIRFRKCGDLRLISHHDLMRCFERLMRRAGVPYHVSQGFHPKPRIIFALALPLGVTGREEVVEVELDKVVEPSELLEKLRNHVPPGLELLSVHSVSPRLTAQARSMRYSVALPEQALDAARCAIDRILGAATCAVERAKPHPRTVDIRPYIRNLAIKDTQLHMDFWVTPKGTARPAEVVTLLGLAEIIAEGAILERTRLELRDEANVLLS